MTFLISWTFNGCSRDEHISDSSSHSLSESHLNVVDDVGFCSNVFIIFFAYRILIHISFRTFSINANLKTENVFTELIDNIQSKLKSINSLQTRKHHQLSSYMKKSFFPLLSVSVEKKGNLCFWRALLTQKAYLYLFVICSPRSEKFLPKLKSEGCFINKFLY